MSNIDVRSQITGSVWKILAHLGDHVKEDDVMLMVESMKMEIPILAPEDGVVVAILVKENEAVSEGDIVLRLETSS
jgi:acetyl-CoA carboxylase biotin carboxyl carrier protein